MTSQKPPEKPKAATKSEIYAQLSESTGLSRKDIAKFFDELGTLVKKELGKKGPGVFNIPGLIKLTRVHKPATKQHEKPSPFNKGEMMIVKAKPAHHVVKARILKSLKEMVK
jgi:hypothetical protein